MVKDNSLLSSAILDKLLLMFNIIYFGSKYCICTIDLL